MKCDREYLYLRLTCPVIASSSLLFFAQASFAQSNIVPDNSLGTKNSVVNPNAEGFPIELITGGAQRGQNLFHSFSEFNVDAGRSAYFNVPNADISNILSRVTGNNPSEILGTLGTIGGLEPNLFLINPNGIIFGQDASLDVGGSFTATTAESIQFGEQGFFDASKPETVPLLTVQPSALFFNQINNGSITNLSTATNTATNFAVNGEPGRTIEGLQVLEGKSLLFAGGKISINGGRMVANGGNLELDAIASGTVSLDLSVDNNINLSSQDLSLANKTSTNSSVADAQSLEIGESVIISNSALITNLTIANADAGNIIINTKNLSLFNDGILSISTFAAGNAGNININTNNLNLFSGGQILTFATGLGNAGDITINSGNISLDSQDELATNRVGIISLVTASSNGNGGTINIATDKFSMLNNALLNASSQGQGNAGNIKISSTDTVLVNDSLINSNVGSRDRISAVGQVGRIEIEAKEITFQNTGQIQAGLFSGATGNSGTVTLTAQESISFTGENTGIFTNNDLDSIGNATNSSLSAPKILLDNGAVIEATNLGQGNGGNTTITADNLTLQNNSFISGSTASGTGGIVSLFLTENLILDANNTIEAQAVNEANGGNLTIDAEFIVAFPNGNNDIIASAFQGNGGNIDITAESIFGLEARSSTPANRTNDIDASSQFGLDGDISIDTPDVDPTRGIDGLLVDVVDASRLITKTCLGGGKAQQANQFIVTGRGGLPSNPNESLSGDATLSADWISLPQGNNSESNQQSDINQSNINTVNPITEAKGWKVNSQGKVILTAEANTSNTPHSAIPWLDSYSCNAQS